LPPSGFGLAVGRFQLRCVSDDGDDFVVRLCEGTAVRIKLLKIALRDASLSKAVAESVYLRLGKQVHKGGTYRVRLCLLDGVAFDRF
jgi:hypothetical protein